MANKGNAAPIERIEKLIFWVRGQKIIWLCAHKRPDYLYFWTNNGLICIDI